MHHNFPFSEGAIVSFTPLTEAAAKAVLVVYLHMSANRLADAYLADVLKAVGPQLNGSKSAQHQLVARAIGGGVEINGVVLRIVKRAGTGQMYEKTHVVTMAEGALPEEPESVESDDGGAPAVSTLSLSALAGATAPAEDLSLAALRNEFAEKVAARVKASESTRLLSYIKKAAEEEDTNVLDRGRDRLMLHLEGPGTVGSSPNSVLAQKNNAIELLPKAMQKALEDAMDLVFQSHQSHVLAMVDLRARNTAGEEHKRLVMEARQGLTLRAKELADTIDVRLTQIMSQIEERLTEQLRLLEQATQRGLAQIKQAADLFALEYGDGEQNSQKPE